MTWSLNIRGGDINLGGLNGVSVVTDRDKLVQDLKCWILEQIGTDPLHPSFGSSFDGGTVNGSAFQGMIGNVITEKVKLDIETELRRILNAYQANQLARIANEKTIYGGQFTLTPAEILYRVNSIDIKQIQDKIVARVNISTANGTQVVFSQPVGSV